MERALTITLAILALYFMYKTSGIIIVVVFFAILLSLYFGINYVTKKGLFGY